MGSSFLNHKYSSQIFLVNAELLNRSIMYRKEDMKRRSLNFKMAFVVGLLVFGSILISIVSLLKMEHMDGLIKEMATHTVLRALIAKDIRMLIDAQALSQKDILLEHSPENILALRSQMLERNEKMYQLMDQFKEISLDEDRSEMAEIKDIFQKWFGVTEEVTALAVKDLDDEANSISHARGAPLRASIYEKIQKLVEKQKHLMHEENLEADRDYESGKELILIISSLSVLVSLSIAFLVLNNLSRTISEVIGDLVGSSEQVSEASLQIATASTQLSHASTEQAASLEETVAAVEELTSMVKANADSARTASGLSEQTREVAQQGESQIKGLMSSMTQLSQDSKQIEEIITVIDSIAFQTNLLALNAAVEAARAGEQGKGFAVVSEAVRALAQKSALASKDIGTLIKSSVAKIEQGAEQAIASGEVLSKVVGSIQKVSDMTLEIASANEEQSNGISQISRAMNQLDQTTQINAATSEEAAASAEELSAQAIQLRQVVRTLETSIRGERNGARTKDGESAS